MYFVFYKKLVIKTMQKRYLYEVDIVSNKNKHRRFKIKLIVNKYCNRNIIYGFKTLKKDI